MRDAKIEKRIADIREALGWPTVALVCTDNAWQDDHWLFMVWADIEAAWQNQRTFEGEARSLGNGKTPQEALTKAEQTVRRLIIGRVGGTQSGKWPWQVSA